MTGPRRQNPLWTCCHLGAREHYAIPRALHRVGRLGTMVTDAWVPPGAPLGRLSPRLAARFHPDLAAADVRGLTASLVVREVGWRLQARSQWDLALRRNDWFQKQAVQILTSLSGHRIVFAHSYSAQLIFRLARSRGWTTVLGQIDPGEEHFAIVRRLAEQSPDFGPSPAEPPPRYFQQWREECGMADRIVVNSAWSREALVRAGVDAARVRVVPLAYEPPAPRETVTREYPPAFTERRPLRLLFAGSNSVVKGVPPLLEAMRALGGRPVTLRLVGERAMIIPPALVDHPSVEIVGPVSRSDIMRHYQECDALIFPSHSDGFGMVQVEAQASGLPIVASRHCGRVVVDGVNGIVLNEVTAASIAAAIETLLEQPALLARFSSHAMSTRPSSVDALGAALLAAVQE